MSTVISVENVSKQYRLGVISGTKLTHEVQEWWRRWWSPESASTTSEDVVWALRDVSFEVQKGEVLGIIGRNGAGKSTLLKILARVTAPTTGVVRMKGRIASLLEVGTGFHPELTGRDNIYLNGAILGMKRSEIARKFDEIVAFSGVEKYIDTPVKRYSSGMYMRLAFAVAAHLEPEILVVDEVLAVGDADFQRKCLGKMKSISKSEGRTVLFVSHNMTAIKNLCKKVVWLKEGKVSSIGEAENLIAQYLSDTVREKKISVSWNDETAPKTDQIRVCAAKIDYNGDYLVVTNPFDVMVEFYNHQPGFPLHVTFYLYNIEGLLIFTHGTSNQALEKGCYRAILHIPGNLLNDGFYYFHVVFVHENGKAHLWCHNILQFEISDEREKSLIHDKWLGVIRPRLIPWEYYKLKESHTQ